MPQQTYTPSATPLSTATTSIIQTYPLEHGGGTLSWGTAVGITGTAGASGASIAQPNGIATTELNYKNRLTTPDTVVGHLDGTDLYAELQNFIAQVCKTIGNSNGLSTVTLNSFGTAAAGTGAAFTPSVVLTPRAAMFRLQQMLTTMLANPNV